MRVALFADSPRENWPSMDRYARSLYRALKCIAPEEDFHLLVPPDPPAGLSGRGMVLWRLIVYPLWARRFSADVYHVLDHSYGHLLLTLKKERTVVTVHDIAPLFFPGSRYGLSRLAWRVALRGASKARWWITGSDFTRRELVSHLNSLEGEIVTIPYGLAPCFGPLHDEAVSAQREGMRLSGKRLILHVGHCQPRKNVEGLLTALKILIGQGLDCLLVQVGGVFSPAQRQMIRDARLEHSVLQKEQVSEEELVSLYNAADVLVMPSFYEGFGFPALEAMACGTPVVASNAAALPEVVGDAGLLIDPHRPESIAEAIARILSDPTLAAELRQRGLERAKTFTWERTAEKTLILYHQIESGVSR